MVPAERTRGYDMRKVVARICDPGTVLEIQPAYARSLTAALARIDGFPVGVVANNPMFDAGTLHSPIRSGAFNTRCSSPCDNKVQ